MRCRFGEKTVGIFKWVALKIGTPEYEAARTTLDAAYSEKAIDRKVEELDARGYLDVHTSTRYASLTEKGRAALREVTCSL